MNPLVKRLETRAATAALAGDADLSALLWEAAAAVALAPASQSAGASRQADEAAVSIEEQGRRAWLKSEVLRYLAELPSFAWARLRALGLEPIFGVTISKAEAAVWREQGLEVVELIRRSEVERLIRRL